MAIDYGKKTAMLKGVVSVDDAEALQNWLQKHPKGRIDLSECTHLHAADLQVVMAARPVIAAWPAAADLRAWLEPVLGSLSGDPRG